MSRENGVSWRTSQVTSAAWKSRFAFTVNSVIATAKLYLFLRATLAQDWKSPKGKLIKAGTTLEFSKDGKVKKLPLSNWK